MLAVPLAGHFEQLFNARYLERGGYGRAAETLESPEVVTRFVAELGSFRADYSQDGNRECLAALDAVLAG